MLKTQWFYPSAPGQMLPVWLWWFDLTHWTSPYGAGTVDQAVIPLWVLFVALGALTSVVWRRHLRRGSMPGLCPACRYDRAGLSPGAPCPECGD